MTAAARSTPAAPTPAARSAPATPAVSAPGESAAEGHRESGDQALLSGTALTVFRLNGQFLGVAEELARPAGLTAARWQVLGAVLQEPLPVAGIARAMGITRQSVQRIADRLVDDGLAEYLPNPAHRRAKLVRPTAAGLAAVQRIDPDHAVLAGQLADELGRDELARTLDALTRLSAVLDAVAARRGRSS